LSTTYRIIANPMAAKGQARLRIPEVTAALDSLKLDYSLVVTEYPGHAIELAHAAVLEGVDVVVAAGGDGTSNEVINGLMQARQVTGRPPTMGVVCIGRGNDFAYSMGVAPGCEQGCQALANGRTQLIDIGRVEGGSYPQGRYFGNGLGIGFDAMVGFQAAKYKHLSGAPGYLAAALATIFLYFKAPELKINFDGTTLIQRCLMVSLMNGRRLGGMFMMAPGGKPDDGLINLTIVSEVGKLKIFDLIPRFIKGTHASDPAVTVGLAGQIEITALQGKMPVHADGETIATEADHLIVSLLQRQINLIY
jgi:diacylglycerol kinase (ATP)